MPGNGDYPFHYDPPALRISDAEIVVQKTMIRTIGIMFRETRVAAVPNGTHIASKAGRAKAKAEGRSAGFPDLIIVSTSGVHGDRGLVAFPEVKAKEPLSAEQRGWLEFLHYCGHHCGVFRSDVTLVEKLREWGFR